MAASSSNAQPIRIPRPDSCGIRFGFPALTQPIRIPQKVRYGNIVGRFLNMAGEDIEVRVWGQVAPSRGPQPLKKWKKALHEYFERTRNIKLPSYHWVGVLEDVPEPARQIEGSNEEFVTDPSHLLDFEEHTYRAVTVFVPHPIPHPFADRAVVDGSQSHRWADRAAVLRTVEEARIDFARGRSCFPLENLWSSFLPDGMSRDVEIVLAGLEVFGRCERLATWATINQVFVVMTGCTSTHFSSVNGSCRAQDVKGRCRERANVLNNLVVVEEASSIISSVVSTWHEEGLDVHNEDERRSHFALGRLIDIREDLERALRFRQDLGQFGETVAALEKTCAEYVRIVREAIEEHTGEEWSMDWALRKFGD